METKLFARKCEVTNEGMNEGFIFQKKYIKYEKDLINLLSSKYLDIEGKKAKNDDELLEWAHTTEIYYWTNWNDFKYQEINGILTKI